MATIRRIEPDEAPQVRELYRAAVAFWAAERPEDELAISDAGLDNLETRFRLGARHEDVLTLVAEEDGELVGFALAETMRSPGLPGLAGRIDELWTQPSAVSSRRRLAEEAVRLLRERGVRPIFHQEDASDPNGEPWQSLGFVPDTVRYSLYD